MNNLEQLTAKRETCDRLVNLGIHEVAFMWHFRDTDWAAVNAAEESGEPLDTVPTTWEVCLLEEPQPFPDQCIPAWTKAELDVMIGHKWPKPDLFTDKEWGNSKGIREEYPVYTIDKLYIYQNGAEASAQVLALLLEAEELDPVDCMARYFKVFKPQ